MNILASEMSPWESLWKQVANATWVAATGIPLLATLISIIAAFLAVSWQISKDQEGLIEAKRRDVSDALAKDLRAAGDRLQAIIRDAEQANEPLSISPSVEILQLWMDTQAKVSRAETWIGKSTAGSLQLQLLTLVRRWHALLKCADGLIKGTAAPKNVHGALRTLVNSDRMMLDRISLALLDWMGDLDDPVRLSTLKLLEPAPFTQPEVDEWEQGQTKLLRSIAAQEGRINAALAESNGEFAKLAMEMAELVSGSPAPSAKARNEPLQVALRFSLIWAALAASIVATIQAVISILS